MPGRSTTPRSLSLWNGKLAAEVPPRLTALTPVSPVPLIVTAVPLANCPALGAILVTVGSAA